MCSCVLVVFGFCFESKVGNFPARKGKGAAVLHSIPGRAVREEGISLLPLQLARWQCLDAADCPGERVLCRHQVSAALCFLCQFCNSRVKLIFMSHGSCWMGGRLIVPSVRSPVPACIQGTSDLWVVPETHSHGEVWFAFAAQSGDSL